TGKAEVVAKDIGRCIQKIPGTNKVSFAQKISEKQWSVRELDPKTRAISEIAPALAGNDDADYAWTPGGILLMASGSKIHAWKEKEWSEIADFTSDGIRGITRMAVSHNGNWIAFVATD